MLRLFPGDVGEVGPMLTQRVFHQIPDGLWWVAWVDHVSFATQTQMVHVVLAPLAPELLPRLTSGGIGLSGGPTVSLDALLGDRSACTVVRVDVSIIPVFAVGDVFFDRHLLASQTDPACAASICDLPEIGRTVTIEINTKLWGFRKTGERYSRAAGSRIGDLARSPSVDLLVTRYPMTAGTSRVLHLRTKQMTRFLLPAAELIRSLVAPRPMVLRRLFSKTLTVALEEMVTSHDATVSGDDPFSMTLGRGFAATDAPYLANMIAAYNRAGAEAAEHVLASRLTPSAPSAVSGRHKPFFALALNADPIPICFPFGEGELRITARCLRLPDGDALVCKIVGGCWPTGPALDVTVHRDVVDPAQEPTPRPRATPEGGDGEGGGVAGADHIISDERPGLEGTPVDVPIETVFWEGMPTVTVHVERGKRPPSQTVPGGRSSSGSVSFGEPEPDGQARQGDADHSALPIPERFAATLAMLKRMQEAKLISSYADVVPKPRGAPGFSMNPKRYSDHLLWSFREEDTRRWTHRYENRRKGRPRSLLVKRVNLQGGIIVYWISIEELTNHHRAVLLTFGEVTPDPGDVPPAEVGIGDLWGALDRLVDHKGRVGDPGDFAKVVPGGRAIVATYKHLHKAPPKSDGSGPSKEGGPTSPDGDATPTLPILDEAAAMRVLDRLAAAVSGGSRKTASPIA